MENYGFVLAPESDLNKLGLGRPTGMFGDLFQVLETRAKSQSASEYGSALKMTQDEKTISFNNRYFVFKKVRNVDAQSLTNAALDISATESGELAELANQASAAVAAEKQKLAPKKSRGPPPVLRIRDEAVVQPKKTKRGPPKKLVLTDNQKAAIESIKATKQ